MRRRATGHGLVAGLAVPGRLPGGARRRAPKRRRTAASSTSRRRTASPRSRGTGRPSKLDRVPRAPVPGAVGDRRRRATSSTTATRACASAAPGRGSTSVAPTVVEYVAGTGIVHTTRTVRHRDARRVRLRARWASPSTRASCSSRSRRPARPAPIDVYAIFNYHLGSGSPAPGTDSETITYDAARDAYYERGPSGVAFAYGSVAPSTHHGCTPNNPFSRAPVGRRTWPTTRAPAARRPTPSPGLQSALGTLAAGATAWAGWVTVLAPDANGSGGDGRACATWVAGRTPDELLSDEVAAWQRVDQAAPPPARARSRRRSRSSRRRCSAWGRSPRRAAARGRSSRASPRASGTSRGCATWRTPPSPSCGAATTPRRRRRSRSRCRRRSARTSSTSARRTRSASCRYYGDGTEWSDSNAGRSQHRVRRLRPLPVGARRVRAGERRHGVARAVVAGGEERRSPTCSWSSRSRAASSRPTRRSGRCTGTASSGTSRTRRSPPPTGSARRRASRQAAGDSATRQATYLAAGQKARDALLPNLRAPDGAARAEHRGARRRARAGSTPRSSRPSTSGSSIRRGTRRRRRSRRSRPGSCRRAGAASCAATPATRTRRKSGCSSICAPRARSSSTGDASRSAEPLRVERRAGERQLRRALRAARSGDGRLRGAVADGRLRRGRLPARALRPRQAPVTPRAAPSPTSREAPATAGRRDGWRCQPRRRRRAARVRRRRRGRSTAAVGYRRRGLGDPGDVAAGPAAAGAAVALADARSTRRRSRGPRPARCCWRFRRRRR